MRSLLFIQIAIIPFRSQLDPIHVPLIIHEHFIDIPLYSGIYTIIYIYYILYIHYILYIYYIYYIYIYSTYIYIYNVFHELNPHMDENWGYLQRNQIQVSESCSSSALDIYEGTSVGVPSRSQGKIHRRSMGNPMGNPPKKMVMFP